MDSIGVIHGRFQVFHNDHMKYLMTGKGKCRHLVVGITNSDPVLTRDDPSDSHRSGSLANPLTYFERYTIIKAVLLDAGLDYREFSIVPFPVNFPELYGCYVPLDATFYLTIYDNWGRRKLELLQGRGLKTVVLWVKSLEQKGLTATEIRQAMAAGKNWESFVPPAASDIMKRMAIPERLKRLYEKI